MLEKLGEIAHQSFQVRRLVADGEQLALRFSFVFQFFLAGKVLNQAMGLEVLTVRVPFDPAIDGDDTDRTILFAHREAFAQNFPQRPCLREKLPELLL